MRKVLSIQLADFDNDDDDKYKLYVDEEGRVYKFPEYYINMSESLIGIMLETAGLEDMDDEYGTDTEKIRDELWKVGDVINDHISELEKLSLNSLAECLFREYDIIEIKDKGLKKRFYEDKWFREAFFQGLFVLALKKVAKKYDKTLILH